MGKGRLRQTLACWLIHIKPRPFHLRRAFSHQQRTKDEVSAVCLAAAAASVCARPGALHAQPQPLPASADVRRMQRSRGTAVRGAGGFPETRLWGDGDSQRGVGTTGSLHLRVHMYLHRYYVYKFNKLINLLWFGVRAITASILCLTLLSCLLWSNLIPLSAILDCVCVCVCFLQAECVSHHSGGVHA